MQMLYSLLFERPYTQAIVVVLSIGAMSAAWWFERFEPARARKWLYLMLCTAVLGLAGQAIQYYVVTDAEQIRAMLEDLADAIQREDVRAVMNACDRNIEASGLDSSNFEAALRRLFARIDVKSPRILKLEVTKTGPDSADATVKASAIIVYTNIGFRRPITGRWRLALRRAAGRWIITLIEPVGEIEEY